ncbi:MAG: glutaminyl-peptide cyclotransferase [Actinomycetota bacterium]
MTLVRVAAWVAVLATSVTACSVSIDPSQGDVAQAVDVTAEAQVEGGAAGEDEVATPTAAPDDLAAPTPEGEQEPPPPTSVYADLAGDYRVIVDRTLGHDTAAFSQGLLFDGSRMFESRGQYGESALTEIDPDTGAVLRRVDLADEFFAEGLALVDGRLIQLTWQEQRAFVWDADSFAPLGEFTYDGEGWGLCHDGTDLWMSNGSATLTRRDPIDFAPLELIDVVLDGQPVVRLNELECIEGLIWANVWLTDLIVVIDPGSGSVVATIDAAGLLGQLGPTGQEDVLNGIAYDATRDVVVLTGKYWPAMAEISLVAG